MYIHPHDIKNKGFTIYFIMWKIVTRYIEFLNIFLSLECIDPFCFTSLHFVYKISKLNTVNFSFRIWAIISNHYYYYYFLISKAKRKFIIILLQQVVKSIANFGPHFLWGPCFGPTFFPEVSGKIIHAWHKECLLIFCYLGTRRTKYGTIFQQIVTRQLFFFFFCWETGTVVL